MSDQTTQARSAQVVDYRLSDGEALILHLESGAYHELNPVGAEIWDLVDGERSVREIADELRKRLEDPPDDLESVVTEFLAELDERDLLG